VAAVRGLHAAPTAIQAAEILSDALNDLAHVYEYGDPSDMLRVYMNDLNDEPRQVARRLAADDRRRRKEQGRG
jgi:hypothetical protein